MGRPLVSKRKAKVLSVVLFLLGILILIISDAWWPGIMLAVGLPLAFRQYLLSRLYDMSITFLVFVGTFVTVQFNISWRFFLPTLFTIGALYILLREFFFDGGETIREMEEDLNHEIEEEKKPRE